MLLRLKNENDTRKFAESLAKLLKSGDQIGLSGELGSGKTTLTRYIVEYLGIKISVSSPTFVLSHEYEGDGIKVEHWDLYRVNNLPHELLSPLKDCIRIIEWADKFRDFCDSLDVLIKLTFAEDDGVREVFIERPRHICL